MTNRDWSILLVEDNPGDALLTRKALERVRPCTVVHIEGLDELDDAVSSTRFDAVLLDLHLPGASPDATVRRARDGCNLPILVELATNARNAGADRLVLRSDRRGEEVLLSVHDSGSGMDASVLGRAFEPFFSTDPSCAGLGLSGVHGIVTKAGGSIELESGAGGTTVRITLPHSAFQSSDSKAPGRSSGVVLLAEDDRLVRSFVVRFLAREGIDVLETENGTEALEAAERSHFDLLVTDMRMPGLGGAQLYETLAGRRPGLPVIFMSGYTDVGLPEPAKGDHSAFLQKPFQLEALRHHVHRLLALAADNE